MAKMISSVGIADAKLSDQESSTLLAKDGNYELLIKTAEIGESNSGNVTMRLQLIVQDDDAKGSLVYHTFPVSGEIATGARAGTPNVQNLGQFLLSAGWAPERVAALAASPQFDVEKVATEVTGQKVYAFVRQQPDNKDIMRSQPQYYIKQERYMDSRSTGTNYRKDPVAAPAAKKSANGVGRTTTQVASNQLVTDV